MQLNPLRHILGPYGESLNCEFLFNILCFDHTLTLIFIVFLCTLISLHMHTAKLQCVIKSI